MALFTDFFPSGGENTNVVNTVLGNETTGTVASGGNAGAVGQTLNFSGLSNDNLSAGDRVQVDIGDGIEITGTVTAIDNDADTATVRLDHPDMLPAVGTTGISIMEVTTVGATSFNGELNAGGNTNLSTGSGSDANIGDSTGATGSSTTITGETVTSGNSSTDTNNLLGDAIRIGGTDTTTAYIDGATVEVGGGSATTTTTIGRGTPNSGSTTNLYGETVNIGNAQTHTGTSTAITGETVSVNGDTIEIGETADTATIRFGRGCEAISVGQSETTTTFFGDVVATELFDAVGGTTPGQVASWAEASDTGVIPTAKLPNFVIGEVHTLTLSGSGDASLADAITALNAAGSNINGEIFHEGDTLIATRGSSQLTYIYVTSTAKTVGASGGFVTGDFHLISNSFTGVSTLDERADTTTTKSNLTLSGSSGDITIAVDLSGVADNQMLFKTTTGAIDGANILQADTANFRGTTGVEVGDIIIDEGLWVDADANFADTLAVTGNTSLGGTLDVTGNTTLTGNLVANGETNTIGDGADGETTIAGATLSVSANTTHSGSLTANGAVTLGNASEDTITINGTTEFTQPVTFPTSQSFVAGGTGATTLGATSRELRVVGSGIATATDAEPLQLVVGADGQIMTASAAGGGGSFDLLIGTTAGAQVTIGNGDLIVLPPLGSSASANRNVAFPSSPIAGTSFEISNLSTTGDGSNGQIWTIGASGDVVMGETLTSAFELDDNTASFKFVYTNATYGWVIIGAN